MNIVLDVLVIAIVIGSVILGWRRGFVKSISGLLSLVLAMVIVSSFAGPVAQKVDEAVIEPWAIKQVVKTQEGLTADAPASELDLVSVNRSISDRFGVNILGVEDTMGAATVGEYIGSVLKTTGITLTISTAVATIGLFILSWVAVWLIGLLLKPILKLPVLRQCNGVLGVVIGLVSAAILLMVLAYTVQSLGATKPDALFGAQTVEKTVLFKKIVEINPLGNWISK